MGEPAFVESTPGRDACRPSARRCSSPSRCGAVQVFLIPRRLDVLTYGHYRLFLAYVTYLGLLQFGLVDGAFVRWAGRPRGLIRREWPRVAGWLLAMNGAVVLCRAACRAGPRHLCHASTSSRSPRVRWA